MFDIGISEILVVLVVALIVFGPKRLPEIAQRLGKIIASLRTIWNQLQQPKL